MLIDRDAESGERDRGRGPDRIKCLHQATQTCAGAISEDDGGGKSKFAATADRRARGVLMMATERVDVIDQMAGVRRTHLSSLPGQTKLYK